MAVLEAMGSGKPVVISEQCHFPDVETMGAGRIPPLTVEGFRSAIGDLLASPALRAEMGTKARSLVLEQYQWDTVAAKTVRAYESVLQ